VRPRAFSLLEVILAILILSVGLGISFSLFSRGTRAFRLGDARQSLANDARRSVLALLPSLRVGDSSTLEVIDAGRNCLNDKGQTVERHAYSLAGLGRWDNPANFNLNNADIYWDRYQVVYATTLPRGDLILQEYQPAPGPPYSDPLPGFSGASHLANDPALNTGARSTRVLCQSVDEWKILFDPDSQTMRLTLRLAARGGKKSGGSEIDQRAEASVLVRLENSGPGG